MMDWDLEDYGPWGEWDGIGEWVTGAREMARDICKDKMIGLHEDRAWAEEDEPRYVAAFLVAGAEPEDPYREEHGQWQDRAALILMQKYRHEWWMRPQRSPEYRNKARVTRHRVQADELRLFYTWLCNQRKERWAHNLVPAENCGQLLPR